MAYLRVYGREAVRMCAHELDMPERDHLMVADWASRAYFPFWCHLMVADWAWCA